jgi:hypothetical protein
MVPVCGKEFDEISVLNAVRVERTSFVQLVEFGLLKRMCDDNMKFIIVGSTAAYAFGLNTDPQDLDIAVEYTLDRWQRILTLAELEDPQPGGVRQIKSEPKSRPTQLHFGLGRGVDVLSGFQHADFPELYSRSVEGTVNVEFLDDLQLPVRIASLDDLVASWRARGNVRDIELISAAEKLAHA